MEDTLHNYYQEQKKTPILSDKAAASFQEILRVDYGVEISLDEARTKATRFLTLIKLVCTTNSLPKKEVVSIK